MTADQHIDEPTLQNVRPMRTAPHQITDWILSTMPPERAALALVLTSGARFHIPGEYLIGHEGVLLELTGMVEHWVMNVWLSKQFAAIDTGSGLTVRQQEAWIETLERVESLATEIDIMIRKEF